MSNPDISQLTEAQQTALQTYLAVTDQDLITAIPLLQRSEWNVQIAISRYFDGEPTSDPLAEAAAAQAPSLPNTSSRHTSNIQLESSLAGSQPSPARSRRVSHENVVRRVETTSPITPAYRLPFLLTPFSIIFRLFSTVLSPFSLLVPGFLSRIFHNLLTTSSRPSRRQLPPADTARRFIREFEEMYSPNPPLPFVESGFNLALEACKKDAKFLLVFLMSPSHDDTYSWVRETLLSSQVHQFLQTHRQELTLWGGSVKDTEAYQVAASLNCTKLPVALLVCQSGPSSDMAVVMRASGLVSASELVAKLGSSMTAQQSQLAAARAQRAEQQAQRSLREEQDSAYERSLAQDRERTRLRREEEEARNRAEKEALQAAAREELLEQQRAAWRSWRATQIEPEDPNSPVRLSIRMPDGSRIIRKFKGEAPVEHLYALVECYGLIETASRENPAAAPNDYTHEFSFRLVSPFPRNVIDLQTGGTIQERVGRGGNLIVEPLDGADIENSD